ELIGQVIVGSGRNNDTGGRMREIRVRRAVCRQAGSPARVSARGAIVAEGRLEDRLTAYGLSLEGISTSSGTSAGRGVARKELDAGESNEQDQTTCHRGAE